MNTNEQNGAEHEVDSISLLDCPFCGSKPVRQVRNNILDIHCPECVSVGFHNHVRFGCRADTEWNTRAD